MNVMFDTADIKLIERYMDMFHFTGVTSNPALIRKAGIKSDLAMRFREIRSLIGIDRSLHIQVVSHNAEDMIREAMHIIEKVDDRVYIKVPVTPEGMKAIKVLKAQGIGVTATAIVTQMQAILSLGMQADYIALYYNTMCDLGINGDETISVLSAAAASEQSPSRILAANIKNMAQYRACLMNGAQDITLDPTLLAEALTMPQIEKSIKFFDDAWKELYGEKTLCEVL